MVRLRARPSDVFFSSTKLPTCAPHRRRLRQVRERADGRAADRRVRDDAVVDDDVRSPIVEFDDADAAWMTQPAPIGLPLEIHAGMDHGVGPDLHVSSM